MRTLILLLSFVVAASAQGLPVKRPGVAITALDNGDAGKPIAVDAMRVLKLTTPDAKFVSWEVDPVYDLVVENGTPKLTSGDIGLKLITEAAKLGTKEPGEDPVFRSVEPGQVLIWGKTPGKARLIARGVVGEVNQRIETIVIEVVGARPPPPVKPIEGEQPAPAARLYFLYVGADGPTDPAVLRSMALPAWADEIKAERVKYLALSKVPSKDGKSPLPPGTSLPCLLVLSEGPATSTIIPPPRALPTTDAEVNAIRKEKP
jgi:hypothetical protein